MTPQEWDAWCERENERIAKACPKCFGETWVLAADGDPERCDECLGGTFGVPASVDDERAA